MCTRAHASTFVTLALGWLICLQAAGGATEPELLHKIDSVFADTFRPGQPGAAVLIVKNGEVVLRKGYGLSDLARSLPMTPETVLEIGSITKQFTAVAILQLVGAGKISLEDDVRGLIPELNTHDHRITLRQLLTHTSGLPEYTDGESFDPRETISPAKILERVNRLPLQFEPGTHWVYCNTGYYLLGEVIGKVTGMSYERYISEHLLQPAGMSHTMIRRRREDRKDLAVGYAFEKSRFRKVSDSDPSWARAAGGLISNVDDLWLWEKALNSGKLLDSGLLLQARTEVHLPDGRATGYGLGWIVTTVGNCHAFAHGGDIPGFTAYEMAAAREDGESLYMAILCNAENPRQRPNDIADQIGSILLGIAPTETTAVPLECLESYAGIYRISETESIEILLNDGKLYLQRANGSSSVLVPHSVTDFYNPSNQAHNIFVRNEAGRVDRVIFHPRMGPEIVDWRQPSTAKYPVSREMLDRYVGDYKARGNRETVKIRRRNDELTIQVDDETAVALLPDGPDHFHGRLVVATARFTVGSDGKIRELEWTQNGEKNVFKK